MPKLKTGADCCGCTACASICGKKAISMHPDSMGFLYPQVDMNKCVECGACEKVCEFHATYDTSNNFQSPIPYGVRLKDINEVMKSRSGGAFAAFSDWILLQGGVIYGVGYKDHFVVAHCRATTKEERDVLRGSKYVQSNLDGVFEQVKKDLMDDKWVLFSGTPCQTSGLKSYIPKRLHTKLLLVDIVCHGVPGPYLWRDYLNYIEEKEGKKVIRVDFRDKKKFGWKAHRESFLFDGSTTTTTFSYIFYKHIMLRESCENCHFTNLRRPSDLTLADFWGWEKTDANINKDNKGLSLVLVNSEKGRQVFDSVADKFTIITPELKDCLQTHLKQPTQANPKRNKFQKDYEEKGFKYILYHYGNIGWRYNIRHFSNRVLRKLKRILKLA